MTLSTFLIINMSNLNGNGARGADDQTYHVCHHRCEEQHEEHTHANMCPLS